MRSAKLVSFFWLFAGLSLAVFSESPLGKESQAQESSDLKSSETILPVALPSLTPTWDLLDSLLDQLESELFLSDQDLKSLLQQLEALKTETSELQSSLAQSESALLSLETSFSGLKAEITTVKNSRDFWTVAALVGIPVALGFGFMIGLGLSR